MPNLTTYLKALSTMSGFTGYLKKYKLREKKCTNTNKKSQQTVSTPIFIKLEVAQLSPREAKTFQWIAQVQKHPSTLKLLLQNYSPSPWNYYFPKNIEVLLWMQGNDNSWTDQRFLYHYKIWKSGIQQYRNKIIFKIHIIFQPLTMDGPLKSHLTLPEIHEKVIKEVIYR